MNGNHLIAATLTLASLPGFLALVGVMQVSLAAVLAASVVFSGYFMAHRKNREAANKVCTVAVEASARNRRRR